MNNAPPSDFDWVTVRSECSAVKVFEMLRLEAESNVKVFNARYPQSPWQFVNAGGGFSVARKDFRGVTGVRFSLAQDEISIEGNGVAVNYTATLTLNDAGECRLRVGGEELDRWQLLRRALEPLLFKP